MLYASALAVLASTLLTVGLYFMKREAERLPSLGGGWRLAAWGAFIRDRWWLCGLLLQIAGYGLYFLSLRAAPLSIVHAALNGGIALFVVLAVFGLGEEPRPVEWLAVAVITVSLIILSISLASAPAVSEAEHGTLPFSLAVVALAALALVLDQQPDRTIGLSTASGLVLGLAAVYAKGLANGIGLTADAAFHLLLTIGANLVGFAMMQAAFQRGRGVVVMPLFATLSNLVPIIGGILVFGEALPSEEPAAVLRPLAFTLAILGAALLAGFGERARPALSQPGVTLNARTGPFDRAQGRLRDDP
jgi:multidrug transporter EmrE-like cation transporter